MLELEKLRGEMTHDFIYDFIPSGDDADIEAIDELQGSSLKTDKI